MNMVGHTDAFVHRRADLNEAAFAKHGTFGDVCPRIERAVVSNAAKWPKVDCRHERDKIPDLRARSHDALRLDKPPMPNFNVVTLHAGARVNNGRGRTQTGCQRLGYQDALCLRMANTKHKMFNRERRGLSRFQKAPIAINRKGPARDLDRGASVHVVKENDADAWKRLLQAPIRHPCLRARPEDHHLPHFVTPLPFD